MKKIFGIIPITNTEDSKCIVSIEGGIERHTHYIKHTQLDSEDSYLKTIVKVCKYYRDKETAKVVT